MFEFLKNITNKKNTTTAPLSITHSSSKEEERKNIIEEHLNALSGITEKAKRDLSYLCHSKQFKSDDIVVYNHANLIFEKHLTGDNWKWEEYEDWRHFGNETGHFPRFFMKHYVCDINTVNADNIFDFITLPAAKTALLNEGIKLPTKKIRENIINKAKTDTHVFNILRSVYIEQRQRQIFRLFISTLRMRLRSFDDLLELPADVEFVYEHFNIDSELVAHGKNSKYTKVPPFIPGDSDCFVPKIKR